MRAKRRGFTLVELMMVMVIIGILISFILKAAIGGLRNAEKSATVSLIAKLEAALTDRIDALSSYRAEPTWAHYAMAAIYPGGSFAPIQSNQRAQVIAQFDYIRAELPDVFVVDTSDTAYPLNFAAPRFNPLGGPLTTIPEEYLLPIGAGWPQPGTGVVLPATGMKGASFAAMGAIYKQLGYSPKGYDGVDSNNNGYIDERAEGNMGLTADLVAQIDARLANHKHKTARSEMLYALLVEGIGPLGSIFTRDDFAKSEVADTDGDGMLEFVDAWGEPLQFYRWPIMYHSDTQRGFPDLAKITRDLGISGVSPGPYNTVFEAREQDPLDPNQTLQAPGWWGTFNAAYPWTGGPRTVFGSMFHVLVDPLAMSGGVSNQTFWDRSTVPGTGLTAGIQARRAYYSRFLVMSGGPDKQPGVAQLGVNYQTLDERGSWPTPAGTLSPTRDASGAAVSPFTVPALLLESQAGRIDLNRDATTGAPIAPSGSPYRNDTSTQLEEYGQDDITNHNLHSAGGPLPSGG
jgi:prepilin-type N-terminal cleavage/methylation domain-containing protein